MTAVGTHRARGVDPFTSLTPFRYFSRMENAEAHAFVRHWLESWNNRDLEAILGHFSEDVVFTSPLAAIWIEGSGGVIRGKDQLRAYWATGLERNPDLNFVLVDLYVGVDTVVINYRNERGGLVCEVLSFVGGLVAEGHATYLADPDTAA